MMHAHKFSPSNSLEFYSFHSTLYFPILWLAFLNNTSLKERKTTGHGQVVEGGRRS